MSVSSNAWCIYTELPHTHLPAMPYMLYISTTPTIHKYGSRFYADTNIYDNPLNTKPVFNENTSQYSLPYFQRTIAMQVSGTEMQQSSISLLLHQVQKPRSTTRKLIWDPILEVCGWAICTTRPVITPIPRAMIIYLPAIVLESLLMLQLLKMAGLLGFLCHLHL